MMELITLFIFALVVAMLVNYGGPKFTASSIGQRFGSSYAGATLATALVFFIAFWIVGYGFSAVGKRVEV